ncbi:MAG: YfhO family protein [Anaerolineae bacterium]
MSPSSKESRLTSLLLIIAAVGIILVFYGRLILFPNTFYSGDTARGYLPERTSLSSALKGGTLPWWEPKLGIGYPLLAEGETGALYPFTLLIALILPPSISLTFTLLFHLVLASLGLYLWLCKNQVNRIASLAGAVIFTLGGFLASHNGHLSIITVAAWLPWLLYASLGLAYSQQTREILLFSLLLGLLVALQFLAGHAQVSLLILVFSGLYGLYLGIEIIRRDSGAHSFPWIKVVLWLCALLAGTALASPQLAASWQLSQLSNRAGGLDPAYFTSFSFHPLLLATYISPYLRGNPYPNGSVELIGYIGFLPLVFAGIGLWRSPKRFKWYLAALAIVGVLMAFGRWNPIYPLLLRIPVFNLFRVPARFLLWTSLGLAGLAALGLETVLNSTRFLSQKQRWWMPTIVTAALLCILVLLFTSPSADSLVTLWRWLPLAFTALTITLFLLQQHLTRATWLILASCTILVDLLGFNQVLNLTYNQTQPIAQVQTAPRVAYWLAQDKSLYRIYTKEEILPIEAVQKGSLYPNYALTYGYSSANLYMPLLPVLYQDYVNNLDAQRLNALNVRYYLVPQLLPVDEASELYDVFDPYANLPYGRWLEIEPTRIYSIELVSYLSHSADLNPGDLTANIILQTTAGQEINLPVRAGYESAEWAYERSDVARSIKYPQPPVATTFPARSGYPPEDHLGHTYLASWTLDSLDIQAVYLQAVMPEAYVRLEQIILHSSQGQELLLNHLLGLGDHRIAYRSEDVLVYRNQDALPRAFTITSKDVSLESGNLILNRDLASLQEARIIVYEPQEVSLQVTMQEPGYLVLADMAYPGWKVWVDNEQGSIITADSLFRAVALPPGTHTVVFRYQFNLWDALRGQ